MLDQNEQLEQNETAQEKAKHSRSRRDQIKTIAIVFLTIMLVFTFFSNTIMNYSLPEVSGQYAGSGAISTSIRGSGTVAANLAYSVQLDATRQIRAVYVKAGDTVEAGQVLFVLEDTDSQELKDAKAALQEMEYNYNVDLLKALGETAGTNSSIAKTQQEIQEAQTELAKVAGSGAKVDNAKTAARAAEDLADNLTDEISDINDQISAVKAAVDGEYTQYPIILSAQSNLTIAQNAQKLAQNAYDEAEKQVKNLEEKLTSVSASNSEITAARRTLEDAKTELDNMQADYDDLEEQYHEYQSYLSDQSDLSEAQKAYDEAASALNEAAAVSQSDLTAAERTCTARENEYNRLYSSYTQAESGVTAADVEDARLSWEYAKEDYQRLQSDYETYQNLKQAQIWAEEELGRVKEGMQEITAVSKSDLEKMERSIEEQQTKIDRQEEDLQELISIYSSGQNQNTQLNAAKAKQEEAQQALDNATAAVEGAKEQLENAVDQQVRSLQEQLNEKQASLKTANRNKEDLTETYQELKADADTEESLEKQIRELQQSLSDTATELAQQQQQNAINKQIAELGLEQQALKIEQQKQTVAELESKSIGTEVTSKYGGTIAKVSVVSGDKVEANTELCAIDVDGKGYTLSITVTTEQSRQVHIGDKATVSNYWWGDLDVTLTAIKADRSNPGQNKVLEFSVEGDVTDGQSLDVSIGERQTRYDLVVPNSAIREDSNGTFILVATAKSTPLATRYTATRVDVTVLAKDTANTAIDAGTDYGYDYVITTSTKPLEAGSQVRLVNS